VWLGCKAVDDAVARPAALRSRNVVAGGRRRQRRRRRRERVRGTVRRRAAVHPPRTDRQLPRLSEPADRRLADEAEERLVVSTRISVGGSGVVVDVGRPTNFARRRLVLESRLAALTL